MKLKKQEISSPEHEWQINTGEYIIPSDAPVGTFKSLGASPNNNV